MDLALLDGIPLFVALVKHGSFTRTAESTGHSKSYISKEINRLEERLGVRLLNRTTRSLSLTPEGRYYHSQCLQVLDDVEAATQTLSGQQTEPTGQLKVGCPLSFGLSRLRPVLSEFTRTYPKITLEIILDDRRADIVQEGFDVMIRASTRLEDSSLIARRIYTAESVTLASPDYLEQWGTPTSPLDLTRHKLLCYSNLNNPTLWSYTDHQGTDVSVRVNSTVLTNSSELELSLCLDGQGITRLPKFYLNNELETGQLVELFTDYQKPQVDVFLIYPSRKHMSSKVRCFIDFMTEKLRDSD